MDMIGSDESRTRSILACLLHQTCHEIAEWGRVQAELGAAWIPAENAPWGELPRLPVVAERPREPVSTVHRDVSSGTSGKVEKRENAGSRGGVNRCFDSFMALRGESQLTSSASTQAERKISHDLLRTQTAACKRCMLGGKRRDMVWGIGPLDASVMFVAAGGNPAEIDAGRVMTGEAAELLDKIVTAMGGIHSEARAERIYMTNVIKCAMCPARGKALDCARQCLSWLQKEVSIVAPDVIVVWGELAYRAMFGGDSLISQVRGSELVFDGVKTIATHHPLEMIKNPGLKARVWSDMKLAVSLIKKGNQSC
ncbi:MAG: uracil-DNA glycosylase [Proteobacteria bacterium]|nr:uracil-DNA glycosylase [Pseudomonadota bacterium]